MWSSASCMRFLFPLMLIQFKNWRNYGGCQKRGGQSSKSHQVKYIHTNQNGAKRHLGSHASPSLLPQPSPPSPSSKHVADSSTSHNPVGWCWSTSSSVLIRESGSPFRVVAGVWNGVFRWIRTVPGLGKLANPDDFHCGGSGSGSGSVVRSLVCPRVETDWADLRQSPHVEKTRLEHK